jgi:hypothetical protein
MLSTGQACSRALVSGTIAALATASAAAFAGRRETGSYAAPLNATSHILWGETAAVRNRATLKYTGTGLLLTHAAAVFWAMLYEKLFGRSAAAPPSPVAALAGAALVSAGAYLTDYHLVPQRLTPGYERRVSGRALAGIFAALAIGLAARDLFRARTKAALES